MTPHQQLWRVVNGAVLDAFNTHPEFLTRPGKKYAAISVTKRVTGTVLSFAVAAAKGQRQLPSSDEARALTVPVHGEVLLTPPQSHCRIGRIRFKRRVRTRAAQAFDITTSKLMHEIGGMQ
jgi:hypothetical protein